MKVDRLIERLKSFPPDLEVKFCTNPNEELDVLSIYRDNRPKKRIVWVDLGPFK